jgi:hypothetical protein
MMMMRAITDSSALSLALARLSNLQQLQLGGLYYRCDSMSDTSLGPALTALVQLPQLTLLECMGTWQPMPPALQQLLAQPLPLRRLHLPHINHYKNSLFSFKSSPVAGSQHGPADQPHGAQHWQL